MYLRRNNIYLFFNNIVSKLRIEMVATIKITTLSAAINEGVVNLFTDTFYDSGSVNVDGATIHCWKAGGHGAQTFLNVVENSCNLGVNTRTLLSLTKPLILLTQFCYR